MKKNALKWIGLLMLLIAAAFVFFAMSHPEMSFPWSNAITYFIYGAYVLVTAVLLIASAKKK